MCARQPPSSRPPATPEHALVSLTSFPTYLPLEPPSSGHLLSQTIPCSSACLVSSKLRREPVTYTASGCRCECHRSSATRSTTGRGQSRGSQYAPETFAQFPPPSLALLRLCGARQTMRIRRAGEQSPAERIYHTRDERILRSDISVRCACICCVCSPCCCCDPDSYPPRALADDQPCTTRDPSLLEPAAISVPSESSPESFACGSALPDAHADDESPDWPESCRICIAENALLSLLLSWPAAQKSLPLRTVGASSMPLRG